MKSSRSSSKNKSLPQNLSAEQKVIPTMPLLAPSQTFRMPAFLRIWQIIGNKNSNPPLEPLIPISRSSFYAGIKAGIYPAPVKLSARVSAWRGKDILSLLNALSKEEME